MTDQVQRTLDALAKNKMNPHYVETAADVVPLLESLLHEDDVVSVGGSVTLSECGVLEHLRSGRYSFLDRYADGLSQEDIDELFREVFSADAYITSSNAITEQGELVNVDGNANRVAAMAFGPKRVFVVAGINKIVPSEAAAYERIAAIAAPRNTKRLHCKTPCASTGKCENCKSPARICCTYVIHKQQRHADRMHVILVGETLGY